MITIHQGSLRVGAVAAVTALLACTAAAPAMGADGDVDVVNTETVQVYTDSSGNVETQRIYEQIALTGTGDVELANPIQPDGLRNLDGFSGFEVEDGRQLIDTSVDGEQRYRTVSNFDGELPLDVDVQYFLDSNRVDPGDVVGADGALEVRYVVTNVTSAPQEVTFSDGSGGEVTRTVDVPIPIVGSLSTVAPPSFTDVRSDQANIAGDGKGGTKLSFTMTLFPPLGSDSVEFGYTAHITDGVIPRADISALPVNPLESPTFKTAATSYQGGADTGERLAAGATEIDSNLLRLRDGAGELLAGLIQLRTGSQQLASGLNDEAVPGARQLADGAGQLDDGMTQLDSGLGDLDAGAHRLAAGTDKALAGSRQLAGGAKRLDAGLGQLNTGAGDLSTGANRLAAGQKALAEGLKTLYDGVDALPVSVREKLQKDASYQALLAALQSIADGVGTRADAPTATTLLGGINAVQYGLRHPAGYAANDCSVALSGGTPTRCGAMDGVQFIAERLSTGATGLNQLKPVLQFLYGSSGAADTPCPGYPTAYAPPPASPTNRCQAIATIYYGLFGTAPAPSGAQEQVFAASQGLHNIQQSVGAQLLAPGAGLDRLRFGLSNPSATNCLAAKQTAAPDDDCGIKEAALFIRNTGIPSLVEGITASISAELKTGIGVPTKDCDPEATLRCAAAALADGGGQLTAGVDKLVAGVVQLSAGGELLSNGASELSVGLGTLEAGTDKLAAGTSTAQAGSGELAAGSRKLSAGADELATGLSAAGSGSNRLADGLGEAADGAPALVDGAQRLSDEGTKKLVEAGKETTQNYGELYATIAAGAERAQTEKMAYGAPEGAVGLTAYSFVIQGEDGEGGRNLTRGLLGLAVLAAGAGVLAARRKLV